MMCRRGEIFYIENGKIFAVGDEKCSARPAIIVSNNKCNMFSKFVNVVYLTTQEKTDLPTHVDIYTTGRKSTALCEQVHSISTERIGDYVATCTDNEMQMINIALAVSLGLDFREQTDNVDETVKSFTPPSERLPDEALYDGLRDDLLKTQTERDLYKSMYEQILRIVTKNER